MKISRLFITIFIVGIAVRLFFFVLALYKMPISVDEGWVGLMSMHILKGEFPIVYWGQTYMGTQEAYFDAPFIYLFGVNAFSIRVYPFVWSVLFMFFSYKLACRIYNRDVGIITLLLLAVPIPYLSISSAVVQPDNYIACITLGTIALLITYDLVFSENVKKRMLRFLLLGFVLGYAFWLHLVIVSYIGVALVFLFLKDKLIFLRKGFWLLILSFIIGSLPFVIYNLVHNFASFRDAAYGVNFPKTVENFKMLFHTTIYYLLGMKVMLCADTGYCMNLPPFLFYLTGVILAGLIIFVISIKFKNIWRISILSLKRVDGTSLLLVMAVASIFIFCRTGRTNWCAVRYVLPIMSVLPILFAYGLWAVKRFSKIFFYILLSIILLSHIWGNILLVGALNKPELVAEELDVDDTGPLVGFLKQNDIKYTYAHYCISLKLTYETGEEIICSQPYNERFAAYEVPYIEEVRKADNIAYIMHKDLGIKAEDFENSLKLIGGEYKKKELGPYTVFYSFRPPYKSEELIKEISRDKWRVSSNFKSEDAVRAIDGDIQSRWGSGAPQEPGMSFTVDLGGVYKISKIRFDLGRFITDYPRGYRIEVSLDNKIWATVAEMPDNCGLFWEGTHPRFLVHGDFFTASFLPVKTRYVKITQLGYDSRFDWSVAELYFYQAV